METSDLIINKVAESGLITIDLSKYITEGDIITFDITPHLFQGLILKEKDFRAFVKENDWKVYAGKNVAVICSADAIVPTWAYMLLATKLNPVVSNMIFGNEETLSTLLFDMVIKKIDVSIYKDQRIVIKGCSDPRIPVSAYVSLTASLMPVAKSIMYGEPCSTVPLYKRRD